MSNHIGDINKMVSDGGPAFPHKTQWDGITPVINYHGISMRDYFAASALQGMMAEYDPEDELEHHISKWAYKAADAMLRAREAK
jgi:hypothetical protein